MNLWRTWLQAQRGQADRRTGGQRTGGQADSGHCHTRFAWEADAAPPETAAVMEGQRASVPLDDYPPLISVLPLQTPDPF